MYIWRPAHGGDVHDIMRLSESYWDIEDNRKIFSADEIVYSRNVTLAIVNQFYAPNNELFAVCRQSDTDQLLAYTWAKNFERWEWSDENLLSVKMAHVKLDIPSRTKYNIVKDMIRMWEDLAYNTGTNVICSSTIRQDYLPFMRIHERMGYTVRGSLAYKRLNLT
jgi:uncharacterized protein (UPF0333 family)